MFLDSFSETIQRNQEFFFGRLPFFIFVSIAGLLVDEKCSLLSDDLKRDHLHINSSRETAKRPSKLALEIAIPATTKRGYSSQFIEIQLLWRLLRSRRPSLFHLSFLWWIFKTWWNLSVSNQIIRNFRIISF